MVANWVSMKKIIIVNRLYEVRFQSVMTHGRTAKFWCVSVIFMVILSSYDLHISFAAMDTISLGQRVTIFTTLVSSDQSFELGFFQPTNSTNYYLGIWYKKVSRKTVLWVANREFPFTRSSMYLTVAEDGNLVIIDEKARYSITNISSNSNTNATLLDSGNFVMRDGNSNTLWQSFDFPTDTFLPGMKIGYDNSTRKNWSLVSWKSYDDPRPGDFSLIHDPGGIPQLFIMKGSRVYWKSGEWRWHEFSLLPDMRLTTIYNFSYVMDQNMSFFSYTVFDDKLISRLVLDVGGKAQQMSWFESAKQSVPFWSQPYDQCDVYGFCGAFTSCSTERQPFCTCLKGFEPQDTDSWEREIYSQGCKRKSNLQCNDSGQANVSQDRFNALPNVLAPANPSFKFAKNFEECEKSCLNKCNCAAFAFTMSNCSTWEGDLVSVQQLSGEYSSGQDLYIRLAASEFNSDGNQRKFHVTMALAVSVAVPTCILVFIYWAWKRRNSQAEKGENLLSYDFSSKPENGKYKPIQGTTAEKGRKQMEIPLFCLSSVSAATDGFSSANKLGEGGFGPVYKGKLLNGHEVAVKRLSRKSGQGLEELKNESMLMGKLQHKNLVKLLGCCIDGDEKILVYEYLPNKSLDFFLFGPSEHGIIDWSSRVHIIEGIAQGLLYLHQFSRVQIIHRDLKASNVLLDKDMNPKISDFGMARIFSGKNSQATKRIVGTYGYMSPEYASHGIFSVKSDVFSFGVLLLEILSGKKNTDFYNCDCLHLLGYAWDLWEKGRSLELMDPVLGKIAPDTGIMRYINIALLCVQEHASDRPTMSDVVTMLSNEGASLPFPKQPAFTNTRGFSDPNRNKGDNQVFSANELTVSILNAR